MSMVAAAVVGSAVVGGVVAHRAGERAAEATEAGTTAAVDAQLEATRLQIGEVQRQFDYQSQLLQPFVASQLGARQRFNQLLGITPAEGLPAPPGVGAPAALPAPTGPTAPRFREGGRGGMIGQALNEVTRRRIEAGLDPYTGQPAPGDAGLAPELAPTREVPGGKISGAGFPGGQPGPVTIDGATGQVIDGVSPRGGGGYYDYLQGGFRDPNLADIRLGRATAAETELGAFVRNTPLAGRTPEEDLAIRRAEDVRLAAPGGYAQDPRFQFAQGTEIVGGDFQTSPGFEFSMEQAQREVERRQSRGGGYGGRALVEAQRRAQGEANQEYYNYVAARQAELARQDAALAAYQDRERFDVARGDVALESYFGRRAGDVTRYEDAIARNQALQQYDVQRQDQGYYNYLGQVGAAAGLNVGAPQAVAASQAAGGRVGSAYGQQGGTLASLYSGQGSQLAGIEAGSLAGVNQAVQGGVQNYLLQRYLFQPTGAPT